ncbi:MAG: YidC/Oxa1 family membrane protein insertase [Tissierellia bacterium]|nr:YidC/Oxa1 family membrane protein insertase [Tissierellia bacterium]
MGKLLRFVYDMVSGIGGTEPEVISFFAIAIIVTTIIFKICLLPLNISQTKNQLKMAELQPEMQKLQKKYKNDAQTLAIKQQQLYKEANYNPLSGCLPLLIQFPVIIAFYRVFRFPSEFAFTEPGLYESISKNFFYLSNLDHPDKTMILPIIAAVSTFLLSWMTQKKQKELSGNNPQADQAQGMMNSMTYFMPLMILWISRRLAAGLILYWIVSNLFSTVQQLISNSLINKTEEEVL